MPTSLASPAAVAVTMPRLSDSMEEGTIVAWLAADGAEVAPGDPLVEVETDKATMAYEAESGGFLRVLAPVGATVAVGEAMAELHTSGPARGASTAGERSRAPASPLARRIAAELGVDLTALRGSGPGGRIVKRDVLGARPTGNGSEVRAPTDTPAPAATPPPAEPALPSEDARGAVTRVAATRLQQLVARRMAESKSTAPDFAVSMEIDMTAALELRTALRAQLPEADPPSVNDLLVKAAALALRAHPRCNGAYADGAFEQYERINIGVAVAAEDALVVPVIAEADRLSVAEIARRSRAFAQAVREGTVTPAELTGATFTVSNLGMYGVSAFTAVLNPPQAAILAAGAIARRPVFDAQDQVVARQLMTATLTCDHRIVYGADAAAFLATLRGLLEAPLRLLV